MALFKKKKDQDHVRTKDGMSPRAEKGTCSVGSQFPNDTLRPVDYVDYLPFEELRPVLDDCLEALFKKEIDAGNADVLDNDICQAAREAKNDLHRQQEHHRAVIDMLIQKRPGTKKEYEIEKANLEHALLKVQEEIAVLAGKLNDYQAGGKSHV